MSTIAKFEDIEAWKTARELTRLIYAITDQGQFAKDFGLKNQIQRAAISVMSNIAEGFDLADKSSRQLARFMDYLETHPQARRVREESAEYEV